MPEEQNAVRNEPNEVSAGLPMPAGPLVGFVLAILAVLLIAALSYRALQERSAGGARVMHTLEVVVQLSGVLSTIKDAETGQRGFLLTGDDEYIKPYEAARAKLPSELEDLRRLVADNPAQVQRVDTLAAATREKLQELETTVVLRRDGQAQQAVALVATNRGQLAMERIRELVAEIEREERLLLTDRQREWAYASGFSTWISLGGSLLLVVLIIAAALMVARDHRARELEAWLRLGQVRLNEEMQGGLGIEALGEKILASLAGHLGAQVAAFYVSDPFGMFRRCAGYALARAARAEEEATQGLVAQVAKNAAPLHVRDVPNHYLPVSSGLGSASPRELLLAPARRDGGVEAVIELGFLHPVSARERELLVRSEGAVALAVRAAKDRRRLEALLAETQQQAEELQTQQEELRTNNEELEQQSDILREQQANLEQQQAELEQTNTRLEEYAQLLMEQKTELAASKESLDRKAAELEASNRYKSEFLANMSHELRTPLNSSLILAKLLSDNRERNLTAEQIKYAQSIYSAGNDLLDLINDILDLSKIEAGLMEVKPESVKLSRLREQLVAMFQPLAHDKRVALTISLESGAPASMETDAQRLKQILRNLLSNALKFTERGRVSLSIRAGEDGKVVFAVSDTGIGIARDQHELIFEAFRQAEGGANRKYGGTGLGLSISRDLAQLLGGEISLESTVGEGSTFTLTLPQLSQGDAVPRIQKAKKPESVRPPPPGASRDKLIKPLDFEDDRAQLNGSARILLIVEDDPLFAKVLLDLARDAGFKVLVTQTADEGVALAMSHRPVAVLLDLNLPDHSGLTVLDRLKSSPITRHIPVQVLSVNDATQAALEMGAAGYMLKPVAREQLLEALSKLEHKSSERQRAVLVVEDDALQRESICRLLETSNVRTVPVDSVAAALEQLARETYDCVVLDLSLSDATGYQLLESMAEDDAYSFPPVIIYTARSLTSEEEQRLRKYSQSIILKGARSPERLLDEVTLFLHQVESKLPPEQQRMLAEARHREKAFDGRHVLLVEDDVRNVFALSSVLEPRGAKVSIARNGREALSALEADGMVDLVLMDIMMPEMDGLTAIREIRKHGELTRLPIIALTAKAMRDDQEQCLNAGASDYIAKPIDVEKLLSLMRVWMPK